MADTCFSFLPPQDTHRSGSRNATVSVASYAGRISATAYFYRYELPKIVPWLQVVKAADLTCAQMDEDEF
ncbi:hypothetical protein MIZ03_2004 [Rhodoferax lithotrophicus]|uniref:Uncharacterized protein n=1 Tax=Rhodoferax lithotrophicus TaxID=2798804 RepID=A0ABN6D549_9BURK|nr:hypothetical protein MIZ03_2004 [Rhodoferax sp. MIZ03]